MTLVIAVLGTWWRRTWQDAVVERLRWLAEDVRGDNSSGWDKLPTGEWLPPARQKIGSSK